VKLIASWYTYLILTKTQLQTFQDLTICCNEEKTFQYLAVHRVHQNLNGSNARFTAIYMNSIIPGFTLA
jgi:hypothetical protein